jgi:TldD protein
MKIGIEKIKEILEEALKGNDFSEIYYEKSKSVRISLEDSKLSKLDTGITEGVGLRIIKGDKTVYGHTNNITYIGLMELAQKLNMINKDKEINEIKKEYKLETAKSNVKIPYDEIDIKTKIDMLKNGDKLAREISKNDIVQVSAGYSDVIKNIVIINSKGKYISETINRAVLRYSVILKQGENIQTGYASTGTTLGFEHFENKKYEEIVKEAVRSGEVMLAAKPSISGKMSVIIAGKAGGTMIHEACGHGLELDLVQDEVSIYKEKQNQKVANEKVTVIDSGVEEGMFGSTHYDGEGNKTKKNILIEKGILNNYMNSYITAKKRKFRCHRKWKASRL